MIEREKAQHDTRQDIPEGHLGGDALPAEPLYPTLPANVEHPEHTLNISPDASRITLRMEVPEDACLTVDVEARTHQGKLLGRQSLVIGGAVPSRRKPLSSSFAGLLSQLQAALFSLLRLLARSMPAWLVGLSFGVYLFVRLIDLPDFPIYFFTDEAVQTVQAADLLANHFSSPEGEFLPTYFQNGSQYNLSTSVYLQVLPYFFFGKSIWVTRGAAVLMTLLAAVSVYLILKKVFKSPNPWLAVLFLSAAPAWFLHSRTAFETALAASFYAAFLYCYLMYRNENPRYLYPALVFGALAFYTYSPMRMVMAVTALLLFFSDLKYHFKNYRILLIGLWLAALLAIPYVRFLVNHPDATTYQMRLLGSYWLYDIPLREKLDIFAGEYLHGLDPLYWYLPNTWDLPRHIMLGYGHLLRQTLPLGLLGVFLALRCIRQSSYRTLLIAILAVPSGTALVRLGITRVLVMVIPAAILTALAAQAAMDWLIRIWKAPPPWLQPLARPRFQQLPAQPLLALAVFLALAATNLYMLGDALINGPLWHKEYGLTGMQYGARQLFSEVAETLRSHPGTRLIVSPSWANGTDVVARFFFSDPLPFELGSPQGYFEEAMMLDDSTMFVMLPEEFIRIPPTRFSEVQVEKTVSYPDGRPGFYFVRLKYVDNIEAVIAAEEEAHRRPITERFLLEGQEVTVTHPRLDINDIPQLFDRDPNSLIRSWAINPMDLGFDYSIPRAVRSIVLRVGGTATTVTIRIHPEGKQPPIEMTQSLPQAVTMRDVSFELNDPVRITRLWVSVENTNDRADGFVHLWEITIK